MLHVLSVFCCLQSVGNMEYKTMEYCFFISSPRSYQINQNHLLFDTTLLNAHNFLAHISFSDFRCFLALAFYVSSLSLSFSTSLFSFLFLSIFSLVLCIFSNVSRCHCSSFPFFSLLSFSFQFLASPPTSAGLA